MCTSVRARSDVWAWISFPFEASLPLTPISPWAHPSHWSSSNLSSPPSTSPQSSTSVSHPWLPGPFYCNRGPEGRTGGGGVEGKGFWLQEWPGIVTAGVKIKGLCLLFWGLISILLLYLHSHFSVEPNLQEPRTELTCSNIHTSVLIRMHGH